jgi:spore coat protein U-like protein
MRTPRFVRALTLVCSLAAATPAASPARPAPRPEETSIAVVNDTGYDIHYLAYAYADGNDVGSFSADQLGGRVLARGDRFTLTVECGRSPSFDVAISDGAGNDCTIRNVDMCASPSELRLTRKMVEHCYLEN